MERGRHRTRPQDNAPTSCKTPGRGSVWSGRWGGRGISLSFVIYSVAYSVTSFVILSHLLFSAVKVTPYTELPTIATPEKELEEESSTGSQVPRDRGTGLSVY